MTGTELITALEGIRDTLVSVAIGGPRIDLVNARYQQDFAVVAEELARRRITNPITFQSLWDWHGRWSSGDLSTYRSQRTFVADLSKRPVKYVFPKPRLCAKLLPLQEAYGNGVYRRNERD